jgi:PKD repeat protein
VKHDPVAAFTVTPASGIPPLTVHFENNSEFGTHYTWYLPSAILNNVEVPDPVTFTEPGSYRIRLRAYGEAVNSRNDFSQTVTVYDPPNADFDVSATTGVAGVTAFTFSKSLTDRISGWAWDFGDGGTSGEAQPVHIYQSPGSYTVSLTTSGDWGSSTKTRDGLISVGNSAPSISPPIADASGDEDVAITFDLSAHETDAQSDAAHRPVRTCWRTTIPAPVATTCCD